ncbi:hypothetical protein J2W20_002345 [Sinomonas atrocyanea]|uniref:hypothetical protein n=1 Tax=Sinomonas atrocyanea TaxID=37927 RepID=UPI00277FABB3|nr:hypothetical protein [Sinomonas atrocyanea]MDQ0260441.1 hypothetical protein [Sinomonas atrocyanea]
MPPELSNTSFIGRLLEEISRETAVRYRSGGRRLENVLTAEVLMPLSYLPRDVFLGEVLRSANGADAARALAAAEIEAAEVGLLPGELTPLLGVTVQPDAELSGPSSYVLIEAKRQGRSSFQPTQLAKEFVAAKAAAADRRPLVLLILGAPPPAAVRGYGSLMPEDAVADYLPAVTGTPAAETDRDAVTREALDTIAWTTWG